MRELRVGDPITDAIGPTSDVGPVLLAHVIIDLNRNALPVQAVRTVLAWAGDPVLLVGFDVVVVRFSDRPQQQKGVLDEVVAVRCDGDTPTTRR
jgi:hypothetical protein